MPSASEQLVVDRAVLDLVDLVHIVDEVAFVALVPPNHLHPQLTLSRQHSPVVLQFVGETLS